MMEACVEELASDVVMMEACVETLKEQASEAVRIEA